MLLTRDIRMQVEFDNFFLEINFDANLGVVAE